MYGGKVKLVTPYTALEVRLRVRQDTLTLTLCP
jgi:hypothetical protein